MTASSAAPAPGATRDLGGCPVVHFDISRKRPAGAYFADLVELREQSDVFWNADGGYWMLMRHALVREAYQNPEVFSSESIVVLDPEPDYHWIPSHTSGPAHVTYRQILNPRFSPAAVARVEPLARQCAAAHIERFRPLGRCDLLTEFALTFPTEVFLSILGLPVQDAAAFVPWVATVFEGLSGSVEPDVMLDAMASIRGYFEAVLAARRRSPGDPAADFVSHLITATFDGRPLGDEEILNICGVLVLAGLDTTKSQLGYLFHHLATHPADRQRIVDDPGIIPRTVEETLRYHAIVLDGRKVARDIDFHGCPMKQGDMVLFAMPAATRDPRFTTDGDRFVVDRERNNHLAFAAGPHRCLGAHLARSELAIALEEWHRRIPDYRLAVDVATDPILEHGGQLSLERLPLVWTA